MLKLKGHKGITLIALVITIIVLLILAGVTIAQITGQDSAPQKAAEAKRANEIGAAKDEASMLATKYIQEYMDKKYVQNIRVEATSNVQDKKIEVGKDGNSVYSVSGVELPKMLTDGESIPPTVGEYVAKQFESRANDEGSYNYSTDVVNRRLIISSQTSEELAKGVINDNGTITWDSDSSSSNSGTASSSNSSNSSSSSSSSSSSEINYEPEDVGTKLRVGDNIVDLSILDATSVAQYYGTTVTTLNGVEYGLFYVDYAGTYSGGTEGTVYLRAKTNVRTAQLNSYNGAPYSGWTIMQELNPDWALSRGTISASSVYSSEKGIADFCNPYNSLWSEIKNEVETKYGTSKVNYVIGGPSIELFLASYNAKYNTSYSAIYREEVANKTFAGYTYSTDEELQEGDEILGEMYRDSSDEVWLASPYGDYDSSLVCIVDEQGKLDCCPGNFASEFVPLISLRPGTDLTK